MVTGLENLKIYGIAEELEIQSHEITKTFPADYTGLLKATSGYIKFLRTKKLQ